MRIISGTLKGRVIKSPKGMNVRPTSDRVRESYFNIIGQYFDNITVLDMYCGTGAIGFEFISRGAKRVYFVDNSKESISVVKENALLLDIMDKCVFLPIKAEEFFKKDIDEFFDYIYIDPPYKDMVVNTVLSHISDRMLNPEGIVTLEHSVKVKYPDKAGFLYLINERRFGDTVLSFYSLDANRFREII